MSKHHNGCAIYDDGQCTCDALPYPRDTARSAVATPAYLQIDWLERRVKELEAEVEQLRDALRFECVDISAGRSWCRRCMSEDMENNVGRLAHRHKDTCPLATPLVEKP